jgi:protein SHQ1
VLNLPNKVVSDDAVEESLANSLLVTPPSSCVEVTAAKCTATEKEDEDEEDTHHPPTSHTTTARIWTRDNLPIMRYDPMKNHGTLYLVLQKEEECYWTDLDLLGRLQQQPQQQPKQQQSKKKKCDDDTMTTMPSCNPLVTVISSSSQQAKEEEEYENGNGWKSIIEEENAPASSSSDVMTELLSINQKRQPTYGLFQQFSNVFRDYAREGLVHDMLECPNPDEVYDDDDDDYDDDTDDCDNLERCSNYDNNDQQQHHPRRKMRLQMENDKFDGDRYLNDLHIDEEGDMIFDTAMCMIPHWSITRTTTTVVDQQQSSSSSSVEDLTNDMSKLSTVTGCDNNNNNNSNEDNNNQNQCSSFFTADESHLLATIPSTRSVHQIYTITKEQKRSAYLTLTDILFAYAFDYRTTDGEFTVESSWTISTLSISLSWLENLNPPYDSIVDVLRWNIRRSLIYPYVRNHMLSMMIVNDVCQIILSGRHTILRCLLHVHTIMEKSESHYLFNKLYIHPLIGWVQQYCTEDEVSDYGKEIETLLLDDTSGIILFGKNCLELGLVELEESILDDDGSTDSSSDG